MHKSFRSLRKFLGGQGSELFGAGLASGQQGRDDASSFLGDDIAMGFGNLDDQSVSSEQEQAAPNRRGLTSPFFVILSRWVEVGAHVPIPLG